MIDYFFLLRNGTYRMVEAMVSLMAAVLDDWRVASKVACSVVN
jgi:hypothetical protein